MMMGSVVAVAAVAVLLKKAKKMRLEDDDSSNKNNNSLTEVVPMRQRSKWNLTQADIRKAAHHAKAEKTEAEAEKAHNAVVHEIEIHQTEANARLRKRLKKRKTLSKGVEMSFITKEFAKKSPKNSNLPSLTETKIVEQKIEAKVPDVSAPQGTQDDVLVAEIAEIQKILLNLVKTPIKMRAIFEKLDREHSHGLTETEFHVFVASACKKAKKELKENVFVKLWKLIEHFKVEDHDELEESAIEKWLFA